LPTPGQYVCLRTCALYAYMLTCARTHALLRTHIHRHTMIGSKLPQMLCKSLFGTCNNVAEQSLFTFEDGARWRSSNTSSTLEFSHAALAPIGYTAVGAAYFCSNSKSEPSSLAHFKRPMKLRGAWSTGNQTKCQQDSQESVNKRAGFSTCQTEAWALKMNSVHTQANPSCISICHGEAMDIEIEKTDRERERESRAMHKHKVYIYSIYIFHSWFVCIPMKPPKAG
jgi:hypothetical protein